VVAAALVALSPTMIATSRAIYTDTYMTAFAVWALERMLAYRADGRWSQLVAATVLSGLAAGSKYPAALLVIPLGLVLFERRRARGLLPWVFACVAALGVFLVTSPFVVLDFGRFVKDLGFERFHMAAGHLRSGGRRSFLFSSDARR
jgi:4-amino-4-deoxy-L-arabinose transferase-like glycosyltransferase